MKKSWIYFGIIIAFSLLFISKSVHTMINVPLHDFDEANRAETARNMVKYNSYLAPLNGSPFEHGNNIYLSPSDNPTKKLYYHFERPPFVFWTMILSTKIFGETEFGYRLPSFIFGIMTILLLIIFIRFLYDINLVQNEKYLTPLIISLFCFLTSYDWWLSSQNGLMDTTLSFFIFLSIFSLLIFSENKKNKWLLLSGFGIALAIMSKGQPAAIIIFPIMYLLFTKKLSLKNALLLFSIPLVIVGGWLLSLSFQFDIKKVLDVFLGFAGSRALTEDITQKAPNYWYIRWWLTTFRPGIVLFFALVIFDFLTKKLNSRKYFLLSFIIPSFILFSISKNKVWWYVLPIIPVVCLYIFESIKQLKSYLGIFIILFIGSFPVLYSASNKVVILYGAFLICISVFLLYKINKKTKYDLAISVLVLFLSLGLFSKSFPTIHPTYYEAKEIGKYYQNIEGKKCLSVLGMPYESALFYTKALEIDYYDSKKLNPSCNNYLLSPKKLDYQIVFKKGRLVLYMVNKS